MQKNSGLTDTYEVEITNVFCFDFAILANVELVMLHNSDPISFREIVNVFKLASLVPRN